MTFDHLHISLSLLFFFFFFDNRKIFFTVKNYDLRDDLVVYLVDKFYYLVLQWNGYLYNFEILKPV